jgi:hypothetical protein
MHHDDRKSERSLVSTEQRSIVRPLPDVLKTVDMKRNICVKINKSNSYNIAALRHHLLLVMK